MGREDTVTVENRMTTVRLQAKVQHLQLFRVWSFPLVLPSLPLYILKTPPPSQMTKCDTGHGDMMTASPLRRMPLGALWFAWQGGPHGVLPFSAPLLGSSKQERVQIRPTLWH